MSDESVLVECLCDPRTVLSLSPSGWDLIIAADAELAAAFHRLTPGRPRSYAVNLNGAKKSVTRVARIAAYRERILAGKGANER